MKLSFYGNFAFAGETKLGTFAVNPEKHDDALIFSLFTAADRDLDLQGAKISWPGEYEMQGVAIQTFELSNKKLCTKIIAEGIRLVLLPAITEALSEAEMEVLGNVDVLVVEVENSDAKLKKIVEEIDPKALIPVGAGQEKLLAELGAGKVEGTEEFECTAAALPSDSMMFVKLLTA